MKRLNRKCGVVPLNHDLSLPGDAVLFVWCPHPQPFSTPCREKASWALSFHPCQPPPAPLLNEGHFKRCFSLHSSQLLLLRGHDLLRAVCPVHLHSPSLSLALSRWEGPAALGQSPSPFIQTPLSSQWNGALASTALLHRLCQLVPAHL